MKALNVNDKLDTFGGKSMSVDLPEEVLVISFSAEKGTGREELLNIILEHIEATTGGETI